VPPPLTLTPFQRDLLAWSDRTRRDLPWRRTRDPWAVLVSELMLQQTQVARVVPKYDAFLARFPTPTACAAAPAADVLRLWAGLGYNRRALNLHNAAKACVQRHAGALPTTLAELQALPGIGPYTARAVLAFAGNADVGVLDTNAARVTARLAGRRLDTRTAQAAADAAVPSGHGWAWNQAMLDLGATVCTKRVVRCDDCPVTSHCAWHLAGHPDPDPAEGSAGTSGRQSTFEGSDRQGRGRLVDALRRGPVRPADLATTMGWPDDAARADRVAATLVVDGLAEVTPAGDLRLPGST
jgi:A/G-specific adenine glycosylase